MTPVPISLMRQSLAHDDPERGSVTIWMITTALTMVLLVGLAVDLGGQVLAKQHAQVVAFEAARAGGQQLQGAAAVLGQAAAVDPARAVAAASTYIAGTPEVTGTASVVGTRVVVDTAGLPARATLVANRLSRSIAELSDEDLAALEAILDRVPRAR